MAKNFILVASFGRTFRKGEGKTFRANLSLKGVKILKKQNDRRTLFVNDPVVHCAWISLMYKVLSG